ncbi:MAG TPA: FkbM family methyltransferase, partial [Bacteroidota bacterium]|nr:FkbM family methyltransferase [Bacteroidota bacterium]
MSRLKKALGLLASDPGLLFKRVITEIQFSVHTPDHPITKTFNGVKFQFDFAFDPALKLMYRSVYEVDIVRIFKKYLHPGDTFVDVGANIGYLSAIAAGLVGQTGQVHSFEPVPRYFERLRSFASMNPDRRIVANQLALGEAESTATINVTSLPNIGWNTLVPGMMNTESVGQSIEVPVQRLDKYIEQHRLGKIALVKIDTEGFEFPVLKGLSSYLTTNKPVFMVEVAPSAYPLLGVSLAQLKEYMSG